MNILKIDLGYRMKRVVLTWMILLLAAKASSQFDAQFSQYWSCKEYYNCASVGNEKSASATLLTKRQWVGMPGAPQSTFIDIGMPTNLFGKDQGVGLSLFSDNIGLFKNSSVMLNYAYKINKWGGTLALGTQLGFVIQNFDGTKLGKSYWSDFKSGVFSSDDPAIPTTNVQGQAFDMGVGAYYSSDKYYAGLSVTHLLEPSISFDEKSSTYVGRTLYLMGGTNINLEESKTTLYPSVFVKTDLMIYQIDLTMRAELEGKFWGGITYRWGNAVVAMVGVKMNSLSVGYAYDISTSKLFSVTSGSHEILANYAFQFVMQPKNKKRINKSIRYL